MGIKIASRSFSHGDPIPRKHTGDGEDVSPALHFANIPANTKELALIVDDPDAPSPAPWVHWVMYKIPGTVNELVENIPREAKVASPSGARQGRNSWPAIGYRGPLPPKGHGTHHYHFKLYALDAELPDRANLDKEQLLELMRGHIIGESELIGTYYR